MENLFVIQNNETFVNMENMYEVLMGNYKLPGVTRRMSREAKHKLSWIGKLFDRNKQRAEQLITKITFGICTRNTNMPVDIFTISAFVYYSKKHGLDSMPLVNAIKANEDWLAKNHGDDMFNFLTR